MLTDQQAQLVGDALILRASEDDHELWFATADTALPEAHRLVERGYLTRRWHGDTIVYRASDRAAMAQELHAVTAANTSQN